MRSGSSSCCGNSKMQAEKKASGNWSLVVTCTVIALASLAAMTYKVHFDKQTGGPSGVATTTPVARPVPGDQDFYGDYQAKSTTASYSPPDIGGGTNDAVHPSAPPPLTSDAGETLKPMPI